MSTPSFRRVVRPAFRVVIVLAVIGLAAAAISAQRPRFYPDDPLVRQPESQDAAKAGSYQRPDLYEQFVNLFATPRYKPSGRRAQNVNTIDEVPDSSWFTNRIGTVPVSVEQVARGPIIGAPPDPSKWVLIREKTAGAHPGFTARDARGETWFLEFDPPEYPEGATAAVAIATRIFWAFGYNQVESFLTTFDPKNATIDPKATLRRPSGARTPFAEDDMNAILERVAKRPDGTYRVIAGRLLPGKVLGEFRYSGTRPDDPNDVVPHEHRRELRALRVFGAWTNLTDLKAANTLDTLEKASSGRMLVKHYLQDVGSTFGMCNAEHEWDLSYEHFYQGDATRKRLFSFGFALSPWQTVNYEEYPSIGKFEGEVFDPREWRPQMPTVAYMELRDDDAFWAARRVAAFTDELIRTVVHAGEFSDPAAEKHLGDVLIQRRNTIARVYLTAINPIVSPRLDGTRLTFDNAAVVAGVAKGDTTYRAAWSLFDNATGATKPLATTESTTTTLAVPAGVPTTPGSFVEVTISAENAAFPTWKQPIRTHFRRDGANWTLVGLERLPDNLPPDRSSQK